MKYIHQEERKITSKLSRVSVLLVYILCFWQKPVNGNPLGLCRFPNVLTHSVEEGRSVCDNMAPRDGRYPAEKSPCPWKVFPSSHTIRPHHSQRLTLGSLDGKQIFNRYIIKARPLDETYGRFLGHFEPQWDAEPVCCNQSEYPNMLVSSKVKTNVPNETLLWTAPLDYLGEFVFVTTFAISSRKYWFSVESEVLRVVPDCDGCTHPHPKSKKFTKLLSSEEDDD